MGHFALESKSGFTECTPGVYLAYTTCILSKIYRVDNEVLGRLCRVAKSAGVFVA